MSQQELELHLTNIRRCPIGDNPYLCIADIPSESVSSFRKLFNAVVPGTNIIVFAFDSNVNKNWPTSGIFSALTNECRGLVVKDYLGQVNRMKWIKRRDHYVSQEFIVNFTSFRQPHFVKYTDQYIVIPDSWFLDLVKQNTIGREVNSYPYHIFVSYIGPTPHDGKYRAIIMRGITKYDLDEIRLYPL
jgi:hypothetical protein